MERIKKNQEKGDIENDGEYIFFGGHPLVLDILYILYNNQEYNEMK